MSSVGVRERGSLLNTTDRFRVRPESSVELCQYLLGFETEGGNRFANHSETDKSLGQHGFMH